MKYLLLLSKLGLRLFCFNDIMMLCDLYPVGVIIDLFNTKSKTVWIHFYLLNVNVR